MYNWILPQNWSSVYSQTQYSFAARSAWNTSIHRTASNNPLFCKRSAGEGVPRVVCAPVCVCGCFSMIFFTPADQQ